MNNTPELCKNQESGLTISLFSSERDPTAEGKTLSRHALTDMMADSRPGVKGGPAWSPATFRTGLRSNANVEQICAVVLDVDAGNIAPDALKANLAKAKLDATVHGTHSSTPEGRKYRVVIPLEKPWRVSDYPSRAEAIGAWRDIYMDTAARLSLAVDEHCTDPARLYFLPRHRDGATPVFFSVEGAALVPRDSRQPTPPRESKPPARLFTDRRRAAIASAALRGEADRVLAAPVGSQHATLFRAAAALGNFTADSALSEPEITAELSAAAASWPHDPARGPWQAEQIFKIIRDGVKTGRVTPRPPPADAPSPCNDRDQGGDRFRPIPFANIQPVLEARYLVKGLLDASALSVLCGPSNVGKTFAVLHIALHIAMGREVFGLKVRRGGVIYVACEGGTGILSRVAAFRQKHSVSGKVPFAVIIGAIDLRSTAADADALADAVTRAARDLGAPISLIVIDTLARALAGGNENESKDMGALVCNADRIRQITGAHVQLIHHTGKDETKGMRGHSSLRGAIDTEIEVSRPQGSNTTTLSVTKQRDQSKDTRVAFTLEPVEIGIDEDGDPVTSCVVVETEASEATTKLSAVNSLALGKLNDVLCKTGRKIYHPDVPNCVVCDLNEWRAALKDAGLIDNDAAGRQKYKRIKDSLLIARAIAIANTETTQLVWSVRA